MALWRTDERFGGVPVWLDARLARVLADFQQPTAIDLHIGYDVARRVVWFSEQGETGRAGFGTFPSGTGPPSAEEIVEPAYWLQDQFFHETRGAWGEPRPRCRAHRHPMAPVVIGGQAWWTYPLDDRGIVRIGEFHG